MIHPAETLVRLRTALARVFWFRLRVSHRRLLLAGVDLVLLNGALLLGLHLNRDMPLSLTTFALRPQWFVTLTLLWLLIASANDSYDLKRAARPADSAFGVVKALLLTGAIYTFLPLISPALLKRRWPILLVGALAAGLLALWRIAYAMLNRQPGFRRRVVIVGAGWAGRTIAKAIKEYEPGYEIVGYVDDDEAKQGQIIEDARVLGGWTDLISLVQSQSVSDIILAITHDMHADLVRAVLSCFEQGVSVGSMPELFEQITGRIPVEHIGDRWLVSLPIDRDPRGLYVLVKRAMDIAIASIGLLAFSLFLPFLALAIKLDSPGPVFYRPERLCQGGNPFRPWKLRTMVSSADRSGDPVFTKKNDDRITRVGRILRAAHVDEFPQFLNILKGEMSAVGPRPERYVPGLEERIPFYRTRYAVKPGMAGWALVKQGYAEGTEETLVKLQYDLYYIKHQSLFLDVVILTKTAIDMLTLRGR